MRHPLKVMAEPGDLEQLEQLVAALPLRRAVVARLAFSLGLRAALADPALLLGAAAKGGGA